MRGPQLIICFELLHLDFLHGRQLPNHLDFFLLLRILGYSSFIPLEFSLIFINTSSLSQMLDIRIYCILSHFLCSLEVTDLLLTALENPVKYAEDNMEQKVNFQCGFNVNEKEQLFVGRSFELNIKGERNERCIVTGLASHRHALLAAHAGWPKPIVKLSEVLEPVDVLLVGMFTPQKLASTTDRSGVFLWESQLLDIHQHITALAGTQFTTGSDLVGLLQGRITEKPVKLFFQSLQIHVTYALAIYFIKLCDF